MQEINFPEDVRKMLWILLGEMPLQARENLAWDSRALYLDLGKRVLELRDAVRLSVQNAGRALPDDVAHGYVQGLSLLTDEGGTDRLENLVDQLDDMADTQVDYSMKIQESKWEIIAEIVMLLIELAFLAAMAYFTGGLSISQMALARARSRLAVLMLIDRLLRMTHIAPVLSEALTEAIQTLAVKLAQIAFNPPARRPDGIDWADVGKAAAFGAFAGLFESVFQPFTSKFKDWLKGGKGPFDIPHLDVPKRNPYLSEVLNEAYEIPAVFVVSGLSETLAEVLVTGIFDGRWEFKWETFVGSGTSGVFGMYMESAVGGGALWLNNKFVANPLPSGGVNDLPTVDTGDGDGLPKRSVFTPEPVTVTGSSPLSTVPPPVAVTGGSPSFAVPSASVPQPAVIPPPTSSPLATAPMVSGLPDPAPTPEYAPGAADEVRGTGPGPTPPGSVVPTPLPAPLPQVSAPSPALSPAPATALSPAPEPGPTGGLLPDGGTLPVDTPLPSASGGRAPVTGPADQQSLRTADMDAGAAPARGSEPSPAPSPATQTPASTARTEGITGTGRQEPGDAEQAPEANPVPAGDPVTSPGVPSAAPTTSSVPPAASAASQPSQSSQGAERQHGVPNGEPDAAGATGGSDAVADPGHTPASAPLGAGPAHTPPTAATAHAASQPSQGARPEPQSGVAYGEPGADGVTGGPGTAPDVVATPAPLGTVPAAHTPSMGPGAPSAVPATSSAPLIASGTPQTSQSSPPPQASQGLRPEQQPGMPDGMPDAAETAREPDSDTVAAPVRPPAPPNTVSEPRAWAAARAGAEPVTRSHTWVDPVSEPPDPQEPGRTTQFAVRSKFDVRRFEADGEQVTDLTVQLGVGSPDRLPGGVWEKALSGVDTALNAPGHRLPDGSLLHVTVERVDSDPHPNGLNVRIVGRDQQMTRSAWWADADPVDYAHEISHLLGLRDESRHPVAPHRPDVEGSLLGNYHRPAPGGLPQGGLRSRHLQLLAAHIGDPVPTPGAVTRPATATTVTTPTAIPTATATPAPTATPVTDTPTAPAATATRALPGPPVRPATAGGRPGAEPYAPVAPSGTREEWIGAVLARTRPPELDRDMPRPLGGRRDPVDFGNGTRMPSYIDDVQELIRDAPPDELIEMIVGGVTFGHSDVVLRGTGLALEEIAGVLEAAGDTARPALPKRGDGGPAGSDLMTAVTYVFAQEPKTLAGDGRVFPYAAQDGSVRQLSVTVRHYGEWEQFADAYGSPVKVDAMHRSVATTGQSKSMQSTTQVAVSAPIGPVGTVEWSVFGRVGVRLMSSVKVGYGQADQVTGQAETRALDGSQTYLDHASYQMRVTDAQGRPVPGAASFHFAVRDGLMVRLPDSVTSTTARPGRIPRSLVLGRDTAYRLVRTEGFGPVSRMRDWAAGQIGAVPGSTAYGELDSFFSSQSFQRQAPALSRGRVTTVPLSADDDARTPLGVFAVEVVPGRARLITETSDAEMRDINTTTVRSERNRQETLAFGVDGVLGPTFNLFGLGNDGLDLRLQAGPAFRYLFSVSRTLAIGGSGAIKSAGHVKGGVTGLYLVRKEVLVQHSGSGAPPKVFHTWSVDRMTRTEARRLAGWDDGLRSSLRAGAPQPFAPAYLTRDRPPTLGLHRVEEFTFADGSRSGAVGPDGRARTVLDALADEVLAALAQTYPGLVAPLDQLGPTGRRPLLQRVVALLESSTPGAGDRPGSLRWRNDDEYRTALSNTLEVLNVLSHRSMAGNMEALTTTGVRIRFNEPGRIGQGHRYVWLRAELTGRRFEGVQDDFKLRYSSVGVERIEGQKGTKRLMEGGVEGQLAFRDPTADDIGAPNSAATVMAGARWGRQTDAETAFGSTATYEPMTVTAGPSHLYRYDFSLTVDRGGYWRPRGLLRGAATLGLLGTQMFVLSQPRKPLIGTDLRNRPVGGGPRAGQVLISIPATHAPAVDPHATGAANPYLSVDEQPVRHLRIRPARKLALGHLPSPQDPERSDGPADSGGLVRATDLAGDPGPVSRDGRGSRMFQELQNHPFLTIGVVPSPALVEALDDVLSAGSGGAWQLNAVGAPAREAVVRAFQSQYLTANFDQSSGPLGWSAAGLMGKGPYSTLWATFRHLAAVSDIQALSGSVPMDSEMVLGGTGQTAGKLTRSRTFFSGGQLVHARSHATGPGLMGTYGLVLSPWSSSDQSSVTIGRTFVHDINRKGFEPQVLVTGTAEHWLALAASLVGMEAAGRPLVPDWLAAAAGRMTTVPGGWLAHVPEKSAHMVGLLDDGMGEVPLYTHRGWSPQPWLTENSFGTYPVNSLDATVVLAGFDRQVAALGLDDAGRERVRTLVTSRVLRSLGKEMTGAGSSVPVRTGAWGWHGIRVGTRQIRVRVQLVPGEPRFEMLDHSVEMEENRRAVETRQEGIESTRGADIGYLVGEGVHTGDPTAVAAGPVLTETGSGRKSESESRTQSTLTVFRAASTEPYAQIATPYSIRITLEAGEVPVRERGAIATAIDRFRAEHVLVEEGSAGTLREHVPLSLMSPDPDPGADLLAPPELPGLAAAPYPYPVPYEPGRDIRHGDGTMKPFHFPETGFDVRRIVGLENIRVASTYAIALSDGAQFSFARADALSKARDTGLTRLGTGSAQALEDGSSNAALTAYYHQAVAPRGYQIPGLVERNLVGNDGAAQLDLYAEPDFSRARLLTVADGKKMEVLRRTGESTAASVGRENIQDSTVGAGVLISSDKTGMHQLSGAATGPYTSEGDSLPTSADQLSSINTKPKTGRVFLFAIPTAWFSVAEVERGLRDGRIGRALGSAFGRTRPGQKTVGSEANALVWVRDDIAAELGLINEENFPPQVEAAWNAVGGASKAWVDADKAYWKKRRAALGLREARDAARTVLDAARSAADAARRGLDLAHNAAEHAREALEDRLDRLDRVRAAGEQRVREARTALEAAEATDLGEAAHEGWADLVREQITEARAALATAGRTAGEQLAAAELRAAPLRERVTDADRRMAAAEKEVATAARRVEAATRRHDTALTAFGNRQALLDRLRTTAQEAAAEYHRVRSETDQLTRWHQEAYTAQGRARLGSRPEPPPVRYSKPAAPPPKPAPAVPVYTRAGTGDGLRLVSPDQVAYALHDVPEDGAAFWHALLEGLSSTAPGLLTGQGVDLTDRPAALARLRVLLTGRLTDPSESDLLDLVAPDHMDAFSDAEVTEAGLRGPGPLDADTPGGREFDGLGGLMPHSVPLSPGARAALAVAQLMRPGDAEGETGWDHAAADLLPLLAARAFMVNITVVDEAGRFQDFDPGPSDPTGLLAGLLEAPDGPRPHVVLSLANRHYQLAVPTGPEAGLEPELEPKPEPKPEPEPEPKSEPEPEPKPEGPPLRPPVGEAARGRPVRVPATGACLFFSFMASDSAYVQSRLPGLAATDPAAHAWLGDPRTVRRQLSDRAVVLSETGHYPGGPELAAVAAMRKAVEDYVTASGGRLPGDVIGQWRAWTGAEFRARIAGRRRPGLVALLAHHGVADDGLLANRSEEELRQELAALYPTSTAPLDRAEIAVLLDTVGHWEERYGEPVGEVLLPLLAHAFAARVEAAVDGRRTDTRRAGRADAPRVIEVHYNGRDHYDGSSAQPFDLLIFGDSVAPKRVKPEERDTLGDVRVNPLWVSLDEVDPTLLITDNREAVWLYTVTSDGRILLGSEKPSAIVTQEQFDTLLAGMRQKTPDLTADELRKGLDGLGHTGIAARFEGTGRSEPGTSRVSGEFRWSPELNRWTVNDKSGRYMSESVRPGLDPAVASGWLDEVAGLFTERLGVRVVPEQVKTSAAAAPPPVPPPPVPPVKGPVSLAELEATGVTLTLAQSTQAALLGDRLPAEELDLRPEQHRLIRLQRGETDVWAPTEVALDTSEVPSPASAPST